MKTKEELQELAQLVRIHEANCNVPYPTPQELNFRLAIAKKLAEAYGLRELRPATITGPAGLNPETAAQRASTCHRP